MASELGEVLITYFPFHAVLYFDHLENIIIWYGKGTNCFASSYMIKKQQNFQAKET